MSKSLLSVLLFSVIFQPVLANDCLRYMVNRDKAEIIWQKRCRVVLKDEGRKEVDSINVCFSKVTKQFKDKTSYALVADIQKE